MTNKFEKDLIEIILSTADLLVQKKIDSDGVWTRTLFENLTKYAYETHNYWVYSKHNSVDEEINEWLYDMVFYDPMDDKGYGFKRIHLIMECEWSKNLDEIKYDFYKLIQGRASHRVMIFQSNDAENTFKILEEIIINSEIAQSGDRYILAGWNDKEGFNFNLVVK